MDINLTIDNFLNTLFGDVDLAKSVFVTPTAEDPWDPYDVFCRKKRDNLTHPDLYKGFSRCKGGAK
jgi:hypothetical protein